MTQTKRKRERDFGPVQRRIERAVDEALERGITICSVSFGDYRKGDKCCPIRAFAGRRARSTLGAFSYAQRALRLSEAQVWDFISGFDGNLPDRHGASGMYQVGAALRAKYLGGAS